MILRRILRDFHEAGSSASTGAEWLYLVTGSAPALGDIEAAVGVHSDLHGGNGTALQGISRGGCFLIRAGAEQEQGGGGRERYPFHAFSLCRFPPQAARSLRAHVD